MMSVLPPSLLARRCERRLPHRCRRQKSGNQKPTDYFWECGNLSFPDCPKMVVIPAGEFMMGSPENEPDGAARKVHDTR